MTTANSEPRAAAGAAREFVERFAAAWARPSVDSLTGLLHPDVVLEQPLAPRTEGRDAARAAWERLLAALPGLRAEVLRWAQAEDGVVFIDLRFSAMAGGRPLSWEAVDVIVLEDGLVRARVSRFDPLPLVAAGARNPRAWRSLAAIRSR